MAVMVTSFDLQKLGSLLRDFYEIAHIRITVFDESLNELISYPSEVAPYCRVIRGTAKGYKACMECDKKACATAAKIRNTHIYKCHAGLTEAVTPLYVGGVLAGYLMFGHVFSYDDREAGVQAIEKICEPYHVNNRLLREALAEAVPLSKGYIKSAAQILHAVASYLILERIATLSGNKLSAKLESFVSTHFTENITASTICKELGIGKTKLYQLSKKLYGCGISTHVRNLRINLAKELLVEHEDYSISEISEKCGFNDYNYFITAFTRETGYSPREYRKIFS